MSETKHTPGPWSVENVEYGSEVSDDLCILAPSPSFRSIAHISPCYSGDRIPDMEKANACLIAAAPELLEALTKAIDFIDGIRQDLHNRRIADWFPEGANNAANAMSEDMRMIGNACADFDIGDVIAKATGSQS